MWPWRRRFCASRRLPPSSSSVLWLPLALERRSVQSAAALFFGSVALAFAVWFEAYGGVQAVVLRGAGSDWLTYESLARSILEDRSLLGGAPVFYYQPLFRYIRFLEHFLLGDGDLLLVVTALAALLLAVLWSLRRLSLPRSRLSLQVGTVIGVLMLMLSLSRGGATLFVQAGASEYPTWIMLLLAVPLLPVSDSRLPALAAAGLLALSAITRANQLPGALVVFCAFLFRMRHDRRLLGEAVALFGAILLLPLAHNLYYGGKFVFFTTSTDIPQNLVLPPGRVAAALWDPHVRAAVVDQLRGMFAWRRLNDPTSLVPAAFYGLQIGWVGMTAICALRRRLDVPLALIAVAPAAYLAPHLFYQVAVYYPRHIIVAHYMMGLATLLLCRAYVQASPTPVDGVTSGSSAALAAGRRPTA